MNAAEWRKVALYHMEDAQQLRERLKLMRLDPDTLEVDPTFVPIQPSPERIARGRKAIREYLAAIDRRPTPGQPSAEEIRLGPAVADAMLAALGEPPIQAEVLASISAEIEASLSESEAQPDRQGGPQAPASDPTATPGRVGA